MYSNVKGDKRVWQHLLPWLPWACQKVLNAWTQVIYNTLWHKFIYVDHVSQKAPTILMCVSLPNLYFAFGTATDISCSAPVLWFEQQGGRDMTRHHRCVFTFTLGYSPDMILSLFHCDPSHHASRYSSATTYTQRTQSHTLFFHVRR